MPKGGQCNSCEQRQGGHRRSSALSLLITGGSGTKYSWLSREALSLERETRTISRYSRVFAASTVSTWRYFTLACNYIVGAAIDGRVCDSETRCVSWRMSLFLLQCDESCVNVTVRDCLQIRQD